MNRQTGGKTSRHRVAWAASIALTVGSSVVGHASESPDEVNGMTAYMRLDNDVFAGTDRGYSNGTEFGLVSPTVTRFQDQGLSGTTRWLNRRLEWLQPGGYEYNNLVITLGQGMFTPSDWRLATPDPNDRPYAGVLVLGVTYNGRDRNSMRSTTLNVGVVGPSAFARETQVFVHDLVGGEKFAGWDRQLRDEPVFRLTQQRLHKRTLTKPTWMSDVIFHYGGGIGNLQTFLNAGAEVRLGGWIPDNFGSAPALPVAENTAPTIGSLHTDTVRVHGFVAVDVRYVMHDITLDGNTFKDSASVEREDVVADVGVGVAAHWGNWKVAFARYFRTREFRGQSGEAELGSITIRRAI